MEPECQPCLQTVNTKKNVFIEKTTFHIGFTVSRLVNNPSSFFLESVQPCIWKPSPYPPQKVCSHGSFEESMVANNCIQYISLANDKDPYWTKSCVFYTQIFTIPNLIILDQLKFLFLHLVAGLNQPSWNIIWSSIWIISPQNRAKNKRYLRNHHLTCILLANDKLVSQKLIFTSHCWQVSILT